MGPRIQEVTKYVRHTLMIIMISHTGSVLQKLAYKLTWNIASLAFVLHKVADWKDISHR